MYTILNTILFLDDLLNDLKCTRHDLVYDLECTSCMQCMFKMYIHDLEDDLVCTRYVLRLICTRPGILSVM